MEKTIEQARLHVLKKNLETLMSNPVLDIRFINALTGDRQLNAREEKILKKLLTTRKEFFYSDILYTLTHKSFPANYAKKLWHEIEAHRQKLKSKLGRDVGLTVAVHDYLENIAGEIQNCALIEENKLNHITTIATKDQLTGLFDHATFKRKLSSILEDKVFKHIPVTLIMFDLDNFKNVNDSFGHLEGDKVLKEVASILKQQARSEDITARYGGEEFALILPNINYENSLLVAERIRSKIEQSSPEGKYKVTVSIGLVHLGEKENLNTLSFIEKTDKLLYKSKKTGKNKVSAEKIS